MTIQEAIAEIIRVETKDIFKNSECFFACLSDYASEYPKEVSFIRNNFDDKLLGLFVDETKKISHRLRLIKDELEGFCYSDEKIYFYLESFGIPLGWKQEILDLKADSPMKVTNFNNQPQKQNQVNVNVTDISLSADILKQWGFQDKNSIPDVLDIPSTYRSPFGTMYRIIKIESEVFKDCTNLKLVNIPDTVTEIGDSAFENCRILEKINIPDSVSKIGSRAFANCKSLEIMIVPNSVKDIGIEAFVGCKQLEQFTLPTRFTIFKDDVNKQSDLPTIPNPFKTAKVGDYVKFGSYHQTLNDENQPIEWQVLSKENNTMLVICRCGLDAKRFDSGSNNWTNSGIRKWLNGEFYNKAFTVQEKKFIKSSNLSDVDTTDNVFLLSIEEAEKYFSNNKLRLCKATEYAKNNGAWVSDSFYSNLGCGFWWLRSPRPDYSDSVYCIDRDGDIRLSSVISVRHLVRPALSINL